MVEVSRKLIGRGSERYYLTGRNGGGGGTVSAREGSEIVIERTVLLENENEVLDFAEAGGRLKRRVGRSLG